jgi:Flp pilus assembly protein TadG
MNGRTPLKSLGRRLQAWRDERGNAAIVFALCTPLLVGGAGLAVETSFDYISRQRLQSATDAAAFAAALENMAGSSQTVIAAAAAQQASANGWSASGGGQVTVNTPPTTGPNTGNSNAVQVTITQNVPRFFTAYFSNTPIMVQARAVAITQTGGAACILALNKTAGQAVQVQGSASMVLSGCDVMSNSIASNALNVWGAGNMTADCAVSAGGVTNNGGLTLNVCTAAVTQAPRVPDPFGNLPTPSPGPKQTIPQGNNKNGLTLQPGSYTSGMNLNGNVTLSPGVYYVSGGAFYVNANAVVSGSGVTIYLAPGANVNMNGNATVNMTAPSSGTYSGVLFFGDRSGSGNNSFNGTATSSLTGDLYFPTQQVTYNGNYSGSGGCTHIVADTVSWSGNTTLAVNCASNGMPRIPSRQSVKLVE